MKDTGERIKEIRIKKGLTLQELAKLSGLSHSVISKYENNKIQNISTKNIERLSKALDVDSNYLMGWDEDDSPQEKLIKKLIELTENKTINWEFINEPNEYFTNIDRYNSLDYVLKPILEVEKKYNLIDCYIYNYDKGFYYLVTQGKFLDLGVDYNTNEDTEIYDYSTHLYASNKKDFIDLYENNTKDLIIRLYRTIENSNNNPENGVINDLLNDLDNFTEN